MSYPTLGCSGTLTFVESNGITVTARERITHNSGKCSPSGTIKLSVGQGGNLQGTYTPDDNKYVAVANLHRTD